MKRAFETEECDEVSKLIVGVQCGSTRRLHLQCVCLNAINLRSLYRIALITTVTAHGQVNRLRDWVYNQSSRSTQPSTLCGMVK